MTDPNPLLVRWDTPFGLPPFAAIQPAHFAPAFEAAMRAQRAEVDAIAADPAPADFDNSVAAFDRSGRLLARVEAVFHNLSASHTSPALQAVQRELAAPQAERAAATAAPQAHLRQAAADLAAADWKRASSD